jgi:hemoglobin
MPAIRAVIDDYTDRILQDKRVNPWFAHAAASPERAEAYKAKLADFISQGTGGPCRYSGGDMVSVHKGRLITEEAFDALVEDLVAALDNFHVPEREKAELLGLLGPMKAAVVQH